MNTIFDMLNPLNVPEWNWRISAIAHLMVQLTRMNTEIMPIEFENAFIDALNDPDWRVREWARFALDPRSVPIPPSYHTQYLEEINEAERVRWQEWVKKHVPTDQRKG